MRGFRNCCTCSGLLLAIPTGPGVRLHVGCGGQTRIIDVRPQMALLTPTTGRVPRRACLRAVRNGGLFFCRGSRSFPISDSSHAVALAIEWCAPTPVKERHRHATSNLQRSNFLRNKSHRPPVRLLATAVMLWASRRRTGARGQADQGLLELRHDRKTRI